MPNFSKKLVLAAIFDFHGFQKGTLWTPVSLKKAPIVLTGSRAGRPFRDPAFHETIVILVPLGPSVCKKVIFSMMMIDYFSFFLIFFVLCFICHFYHIC